MVWIEYRCPNTAANTTPGWRFEVSEHEVRSDFPVVGNGKADAALVQLRPAALPRGTIGVDE